MSSIECHSNYPVKRYIDWNIKNFFTCYLNGKTRSEYRRPLITILKLFKRQNCCIYMYFKFFIGLWKNTPQYRYPIMCIVARENLKYLQVLNDFIGIKSHLISKILNRVFLWKQHTKRVNLDVDFTTSTLDGSCFALYF